MADVDEGRAEGLTTAELVEFRRKLRVVEMEVEILERAHALATRPGNGRPAPQPGAERQAEAGGGRSSPLILQ